MAARFWVGGTGNWDASDTSHWSTTSGGGSGAAVPTASDDVTFDSNSGTSATVTITGATAVCLTLTINKSDITITCSAGLTVSGVTTFTTGSLNTNGQAWSTVSLSSTGSSSRTLTLGASTVSCTTGNWRFDGTGSTLSAASSTLNLPGASQILTGDANDTYGTINATGSGLFQISLALSCTTFTRTGTAAKADEFRLGGTLTVSGTCTLNSNSSINRLLVRSDTLGTPRTLSAGTLVATNVINFRDITGAGAATWTTAASGATFFGNCLGNSGITFTPSATQTATGTASFTWSTHGWTSRVPLPQDDVVINNAFIAGRTVTIDMPQLGANIDASGATGSPALTWNTTTESYGNIALAAGIVMTGSSNVWTWAGRSSHTITNNGASWGSISRPAVGGPGGTYTLQDTMTYAASSGPSSITVSAGTLDLNSKDITTGNITTTGTGTLTCGTMTYTNNNTSTGNVVNFATTSTVNAASMTIVLNTSTVARTITGGGKTIGTVTYTVAGSTGALLIGSTGTTITNFNFSDATNARTVTFTSGTTINFTNFNVNGGSGRLVTINASTPGTAATISKSSGAVICDWLSIQDSAATGGASWNAGSDSTNVSGNTGWVFNDGIAQSENVTVTESVGYYSELVATREQINVDLTFFVNVSESIGVAESHTEHLIHLINQTETITTTESYKLMVESYINKSESISVTESSNVTQVFNTSVSDSISLSESVATTLVWNTNVSESITVGESIKLLLIHYINQTESITVSEATGFTVVNNITVSDTIGGGNIPVPTPSTYVLLDNGQIAVLVADISPYPLYQRL